MILPKNTTFLWVYYKLYKSFPLILYFFSLYPVRRNSISIFFKQCNSPERWNELLKVISLVNGRKSIHPFDSKSSILPTLPVCNKFYFSGNINNIFKCKMKNYSSISHIIAYIFHLLNIYHILVLGFVDIWIKSEPLQYPSQQSKYERHVCKTEVSTGLIFYTYLSH